MAFKGDLETLILAVLQEDGLHGYEIVKRIVRLSESALSVGEGQLYPALHRLEADGLVRSEWVPQDGKPPRRTYCLTSEGRGALKEKRQAWETFARGVSAILDRTPSPVEGN